MNEENKNLENKHEDAEILPDISTNKTKTLFQELEIMALQQQTAKTSIDFSKLNEKQVDKLLDIMSVSENNAFSFHNKRLDNTKDIEIKKIEASVINQKTLRIIAIAGIIAIPLITLCILFFKENYFVHWVVLLGGLGGGAGIAKLLENLKINNNSGENPFTK